MTVKEHLRQLLKDRKSEEEIRAAIEPKLAPGCKLRIYVESCITKAGTSGYKQCAEIFGCDDPNENQTDCGACQGG